jgi:hypothetical protein
MNEGELSQSPPGKLKIRGTAQRFCWWQAMQAAGFALKVRADGLEAVLRANDCSTVRDLGWLTWFRPP